MPMSDPPTKPGDAGLLHLNVFAGASTQTTANPPILCNRHSLTGGNGGD